MPRLPRREGELTLGPCHGGTPALACTRPAPPDRRLPRLTSDGRSELQRCENALIATSIPYSRPTVRVPRPLDAGRSSDVGRWRGGAERAASRSVGRATHVYICIDICSICISILSRSKGEPPQTVVEPAFLRGRNRRSALQVGEERCAAEVAVEPSLAPGEQGSFPVPTPVSLDAMGPDANERRSGSGEGGPPSSPFVRRGS